MKPLNSNPVSCHTANTHGRSLQEIQDLAAKWEEPPVLYTLIDFGPMVKATTGKSDMREFQKVWNSLECSAKFKKVWIHACGSQTVKL
jgi:hypothetical protein